MKGTIAFDIIGTCFSLDLPRQELVKLGASPQAMELWFAQTLRDAFALSHAGGYQPLQVLLEAELPRLLVSLGINATKAQQLQVMHAFAELELQLGAKLAFKQLKTAGWRLVALTNGSEKSTYKLLEQANVLSFFDRIFSCDVVQKTKPHADVYNLVKRDNSGEVWLIAAHAWDIMGATLAGLRTTFITQDEKAYLAVYPQPEITALDLVDAANQIVAMTE